MIPLTEHRYRQEIETAISAVTAAGRVVRDLYERVAATTHVKTDGSPVTDADLAADKIIRELLSSNFPNDAILTEEGVDDQNRLCSSRCWIVDPIDGTQQFVQRTGDFDVLVALVIDGRPAVAAGYQPTEELLLTAVVDEGAWIRRGDDGDWRALWLEAVGDDTVPVVATAIWFGGPANRDIVNRVAGRIGAADPEVSLTGFSPRIFLPGRRLDAMLGINVGSDQSMASEWDFAVSDLLIHEAGGVVTDLRGQLHRYNKPGARNDGGLIAAADPATHAAVLTAVQPEL